MERPIYIYIFIYGEYPCVSIYTRDFKKVGHGQKIDCS